MAAVAPPPPPAGGPYHPPAPPPGSIAHPGAPPPRTQTPQPPREPHLLSLKVLRAARPSLVPTQTPYYEPTSLGATALAELDERTLPGRGAGGGVSGTLMLPSTFGTIYLGETFSALLCLSNDLAQLATAATTATTPTLKIEMLTPSQNKHLLTPTPPPAPPAALAPGGSLETLVQHEVNEMGTHALECTVQYGVRSMGEDGQARVLGRSFRKVYRFQVSNPLKVKTKAHAPSAQTPTTLLDKDERRKVFLEVLLENLCGSGMSFSRVQFDPTADWTSHDANFVSSAQAYSPEPISLFSGEAALLPPGAVRQYLWVLTPTATAAPAAPGSSQALGRLDIAWRTPNGEPGRLQTAMLGRKVPLAPMGTIRAPAPPPLIPPSAFDKALPPLASDSPSNSPQLTGSPQRSSPAPYQPKSALSASQNARTPTPKPQPHLPDASGLEFDLTLTSIMPGEVELDRPFTLNFHLDVNDRSPVPLIPDDGGRHLELVAQHVQWHSTPVSIAPPEDPANAPQRKQLVTLNVPGAGPVATTAAGGTTSLDQQQLLRSPPQPGQAAQLAARASVESLRSAAAQASLAPHDPPQVKFDGVALPRPTPVTPSNPATPSASRQVVRVGPSTVSLAPITLAPTSGGAPATATVEFKMRFMGLEPGLWKVGGLRLLLVSEHRDGEEKEAVQEGRERLARIVWEHEVVAEVVVGKA